MTSNNSFIIPPLPELGLMKTVRSSTAASAGQVFAVFGTGRSIPKSNIQLPLHRFDSYQQRKEFFHVVSLLAILLMLCQIRIYSRHFSVGHISTVRSRNSLKVSLSLSQGSKFSFLNPHLAKQFTMSLTWRMSVLPLPNRSEPNRSAIFEHVRWYLYQKCGMPMKVKLQI